MQDITLMPADIATMSPAQLAALPPAQKAELDRNINQALSWLKKARTKLDEALNQCYGDQARQALREAGRDFGTAHLTDGPLRVKVEVAKKVSWDQETLTQIAERIAAAGDKPAHYLDIKLSVSESRYAAWPPSLKQQFMAARTVQPGKPDFTLSVDEEAA